MELQITTSLSFGPLLQNALLNTTSLGHGNLGMVTTSNNENVLKPGTKGRSLGILDGNNVERTLMLLNVHKGTNSTRIASLGDHNHGTNLKLENIRHLSRSDINLDGIVGLDIGIGVANGTSIMGDSDGNLVGGNKGLGNTAKLVGSLLLVDTVKNKASLGIKQETESVTTLFEFNDIHESGGEVVVGTDLAVYLDTTLHADLDAFLVGECVLESVTEDDADWEAFALFVGTWGGFGCPDTSHFAEVPVAWGIEPL